MRLLALLASLWMTFAPNALAQDVLYRSVAAPNGAMLSWRDGQYGPIATFQAALRTALAPHDAALAASITPDGEFGPITRRAISALLQVDAYRDLGADHGPVISTALWTRLLPDTPPPDAPTRAATLVLTYENTFFGGVAHWNFCQSNAASTRRTAEPCRSNDPNSFLTWGPRGATAGGGREIQAVLLEADRIDRSLIDSAFGAEAAAVRRFAGLEQRTPRFETERYLCSIWLDEARAVAWAQGFATLGQSAAVRQAYADVYASPDFDGGKMAAFLRLYEALGRTPTEVDYGFFLDRSTHTSGIALAGHGTNSANAITRVADLIREDLGDPAAAAPWQVRRAISRILVPSNRRADRNGRDVVFFVDGAGIEGLTASERDNWVTRGARYASGVGLSDLRPAPALQPTRSFPTRGGPRPLTDAEFSACPIRVLNWENPENGRSRRPPIAP